MRTLYYIPLSLVSCLFLLTACSQKDATNDSDVVKSAPVAPMAAEVMSPVIVVDKTSSDAIADTSAAIKMGDVVESMSEAESSVSDPSLKVPTAQSGIVTAAEWDDLANWGF